MKINYNNHKAIGTQYENYAISYLEKQGYTILEQNFHSSFGEIDIIAKHNKMIVFFEIKYRSNSFYGTGGEAVTPVKQRRICRTALFYITKHGLSTDNPYRFDVISINQKNEIEHIKNAFDYIE